MVVIATVVTGVVAKGLEYLIVKVIMDKMLHDPNPQIENLFKNLPLIGASLFAVGLVILASDFMENAGPPRPLTMRNSLWIGLVQGLCLPFRGFSRSGATISTGLFCGVSRRLSEEFSFALAVALTPVLVYLSFTKMYAHQGTKGPPDILAMLLPGTFGMVCSFLAGLVALRLLSAVLESGRWRYFGVYCLVFAVIVFWSNYWLSPLPSTGN